MGEPMEALKALFSLLPHIETLDVAVVVDLEDPWGVEIICSMDSVRPGEWYDGVMTITALVMFGFIVIAKKKSDMKPWKNPHDKN